MDSPKRKRVTIKPKTPNPLFEKWLTEWRDRAKASDSKMQYPLSKALTSLQKYPLPLETGKDCKILHGFGEKLCKMLDDKLAQYQAENGNIIIQPFDDASDVLKPPTPDSPTKRKTAEKRSPHKRKEYIPQIGSGAFAILVALYEKSSEANYVGYMTKAEIVERGQKLCNTSFTKAGPDTVYTAWSSMKTLLEKKLVVKQSNPPKFSLTNEGTELAEKLYIQQKIEEFKELENEPVASCSKNSETKKVAPPTPKKRGPILKQKPANSNVNNPVRSTSASSLRTLSTNSTQSTQSSHESVILAPNSFEIILLVDCQELNGSNINPEKDPIIAELKILNVPHEVRNLKVGDYVWICRDNFNRELVLPYIVERKRMDDLGHSIKDDRFHEQKFRLKQCGLSNLIYLIENFGKNERVGLPLTTLLQAATNTLVQGGFTVKFTEDLRGTCQYLACLTNIITNLFKSKTLVSCPKEDLQEVIIDDDLITLMHFKEFNKTSSKNKHFTVKEMFVKQLIQIKGMSVEKALAIVEKYPTPTALKLAYEESAPTQREKLLSNIQFGTLKKNVGPVLSKIICQIFCNDCYQ